ncbi:hypothetical protein [Kitasatospora sp. NPDC051914]|uniref:hypothetical protein n=1 Tax=Kitasatospora sp. NPDC051914 TaxID=3154945 RepID=UPI0034127546
MTVRTIDWKYAIGPELTDPGFDFTVLAGFRARLVEHGTERLIFDRLVEHCRQEGLISAGGKQRTDSTHDIGAVRDLNRLELAGESVRAALPLPRPAQGQPPARLLRHRDQRHPPRRPLDRPVQPPRTSRLTRLAHRLAA